MEDAIINWCDDHDLKYLKIENYYHEIEDYENMMKYFLMSIENGNSNGMNCLGKYYELIKDIKNMKKFYVMGINSENTYCMHNMGIYYNNKKKYEKANTYF